MASNGEVLVTASRSRVVLGLIGWVVVCFAVATLGGFFRPGEWYGRLQKPAWTPPAWIFGPVWTVLYTLMAVAAWLVWQRGGWAAQRWPLVAFLLQLFFNALWSPLFFGLRSPGLAFADIVLLWLALVATGILFWKALPLAGALLVPYLAWATFAAVLNYTVWQLNS